MHEVSWDDGDDTRERPWRDRVLTFAAVGALFLALGIAGRIDAETARDQAATPPVAALPAEDEVGWSCRIQGNLDCGLNPFQGPALTAAWAS